MSGVETRTRAARIFGFLDLLSRITCRILRELVQYLIVFVDIYNAIQVLGRASRNVHQETKETWNCSRLVGASLPDSIWSPVIVLDVPCVPIQVVEGWRPRSVWIWCQRKVDIFQGVLCPTQGNRSLRSRSFSIPIDVSWPIDGNMLSQYFTHTHADDLAQRFSLEVCDVSLSCVMSPDIIIIFLSLLI